MEKSRRALLTEAAAAVCTAALVVKLLPFRWGVRLSSRRAGAVRGASPAEIISDVRWGIDVVTRWLPWTPVCIQRGLAGQWMLRRRGIDAKLHYGLATEAEELKAHVWVEAAGETLVGGEELVGYARVATFP